MIKGEKYVADKLKKYSSQEVESFVNRKKVYYEALEKTLQTLGEEFDKVDGQAIESIREEVNGLKYKKSDIEALLNDVKKTLEYDV